MSEPGGDRDPRDGADALNVATARLSGFASVETARAEGEAADVVLAEAADRNVDEVVVGATSGASGTETGLGTTARAVVTRAIVPVVVVPPSRSS